MQYVGRAFKNEACTYLVSSVPPIELAMTGYHFNPYHFPCIEIPANPKAVPDFTGQVFIDTKRTHPDEEISVAEFREVLNQRIDYLVKLAATAKMRQTNTPTHCVVGRSPIGFELPEKF